VVTTETAPPVPVECIRTGRDAVDLPKALGQLPGDVVLCEGGPTLNGDLLDGRLIDEWCLTLSPMVVGGDAGRAARSARAHPIGFQLAHLLEDDGFLFIRALRAGAR
jgi:riboflavin biosynthesis pyrimidine reductase